MQRACPGDASSTAEMLNIRPAWSKVSCSANNCSESNIQSRTECAQCSALTRILPEAFLLIPDYLVPQEQPVRHQLKTSISPDLSNIVQSFLFSHCFFRAGERRASVRLKHSSFFTLDSNKLCNHRPTYWNSTSAKACKAGVWKRGVTPS